MLVDVKISGVHPIIAMVTGCAPRWLKRGVYVNCGFNFYNAIRDESFEHFFDDDTVPAFGVADSIEQFMDKFRATLEASPNEYAVGFTEVRRVDQPLEGGWRWHKWGPYIGTKTPTCEYLHDEPEIESVMTFSVIRRTNTGKGDSL